MNKNLKAAFDKVRNIKVDWDVVRDVGEQTLSDLHSPKERVLLAAALLAPIPGSVVAYGLYRVKKYKDAQRPAL